MGDQLLPSTFGKTVADVLVLVRIKALDRWPLQQPGMVEPAESPGQMLGTATHQSDDVTRSEESVNRDEIQDLVVSPGQANGQRESNPTEPWLPRPRIIHGSHYTMMGELLDQRRNRASRASTFARRPQ